ncbi:MAG: glycoside hydrolase family 2, partial [Phycisphaerae bacterium]
MTIALVWGGLLGVSGGIARADDAWKPAAGPLMSRFAKDVSPDKVLPEYPRPQMVRKEWQNLNGLWSYAIQAKEKPRPEKWDGQILVPFAVESALSGVMKPVGPDNRLWYRRTFKIPAAWREGGRRVLLHFGAVDWDATVFVNGREVGRHRGGYDPFSFDVTAALSDAAEQELVVSVWDPTDTGTQPRGKQILRPHGIWYTAVTGIWQTVWLEPVPAAYVESLKIVPDVDRSGVRVTVQAAGRPGAAFKITLFAPNAPTRALATAEGTAGQPIFLYVDNATLWTPDAPVLYPFEVTLTDGGDTVSSYFGLRKVSLGKDEKGVTRIMLNNRFLFQIGPLDQGWWPDGLYTAPTDEALKYDIEITKKLGMNMARKHVKVEPARWYYWCDKLGLLVWQDMPSGDRYIGGNDPDIQRTKESAEQFETEWTRIITAFGNHPSIIMWVPFNEGWGQFDTPRIVELTRKTDPTRLVNNASGWTDRGVGDVHDIHVYPGPGAPPAEEKRAIVLGEFGGLGLPLEGHTWQPKGNWGYRSYTDSASLTDAYVQLFARLHRLVGEPGLSAAVYTQTTDVEIEVNGLMTYDRAVIKMDAERIAAAARKLHGPPPKVTTLVPDARSRPQTWRYTTTRPKDGWEKEGFDDSGWQTGESGFGTRETPGAIVRTSWSTPDIWLRRVIELPAAGRPNAPNLTLHHDEDAEVYINGVLAARRR